MSEKSRHSYRGAAVEVTWDQRLCIHVGECTRARGAIFVSGRKPWCDPDVAEAAEVAEVVERCPSGALTYRSDGLPAEAPPSDNTIVVANNGPLSAHGDLHIDGAPDDMPGVRLRATLCRCGQSANKPFCDNSHETSEFRDRGPIGTTGDPMTPAGGALEITPSANGPLVLNGNVALVSGHGRLAWRGAKTALCRCGASANKPFCDGSHSRIGFTSE